MEEAKHFIKVEDLTHRLTILSSLMKDLGRHLP